MNNAHKIMFKGAWEEKCHISNLFQMNNPQITAFIYITSSTKQLVQTAIIIRSSLNRLWSAFNLVGLEYELFCLSLTRYTILNSKPRMNIIC